MYRQGKSRLIVVSLFNFFVMSRLTSASGHSGEEMATGDSSRILAVTTGVSGDHSQKHVQILAHPQSASAASSLYGISRPGRHLGIQGIGASSLSPTNLLGLASAQNYGYAVPEAAAAYGEHGAASGSSYGHHGGYGGWGFAKADCNSALGLLGVLGLVSFLQNVLRQMSTTTASPTNGKRRKRSDQTVEEAADKIDAVLSSTDTNNNDYVFEYNSDLHRVTNMMLPLMTVVAHARDRFVPHYCTHREVCQANNILVKEFGPQGRSLGYTITEAVANMLSKDVKSGYKQVEGKKVREAGKSGRSGINCNNLFKNCPALQWLPTYVIPQTMLLNQSLPKTFTINV